MMIDYRANPPKVINGSKVVRIKDYKFQVEKDLCSGAQTAIQLPTSNVLQFFTEDGSVISIRPSGTEPKIKFYFGVRETLSSRSAYAETENKLNEKLRGIINSLNLK